MNLSVQKNAQIKPVAGRQTREKCWLWGDTATGGSGFPFVPPQGESGAEEDECRVSRSEGLGATSEWK